MPIIFAHPEPTSSSAALKDETVATLMQAGHAMTLSDLYAMGWNRALGPDEFARDRADPGFLDRAREQAWRRRALQRAGEPAAPRRRRVTAWQPAAPCRRRTPVSPASA